MKQKKLNQWFNRRIKDYFHWFRYGSKNIETANWSFEEDIYIYKLFSKLYETK